MLNKFDCAKGNNFKLEIQGSKHDFRKNLFCVRVPCIWNNLPNYVVNSKDVHQFKINIDNFWSKYDIELLRIAIVSRIYSLSNI